MNFKKFAIPAVLASSLFIAGCSDDDKVEKAEKPTTVTEETPVVETPVPDVTLDPEEPVEVNTELDAFGVIQTYFEGISEKDIDKVKSVYNDQTMIDGYVTLFENFDVETTIDSFEVISQKGTDWVFKIEVVFEERNGSADYHNNISTYEVGVNTEESVITFLEILNTDDLQG